MKALQTDHEVEDVLGADAGNGLQLSGALFQSGMFVLMVSDGGLHGGDFRLKRLDDSFQTFRDRRLIDATGSERFASVLLLAQGLSESFKVLEEQIQRGHVVRKRFPERRGMMRSKLRQQTGVQSVGFGAFSAAFCPMTHMGGIGEAEPC